MSNTIDIEKGDDLIMVIYDQIYNHIAYIIRNGQLDLSNLDELIKAAMETVEYLGQSKSLSGTQKAEIARQVIIEVIEDLQEKGKIEKKIADGIIQAIQVMGPVMFKLIIMADKGQFDFIHQAVSSWCAPGGCCAKPCCTVV